MAEGEYLKTTGADSEAGEDKSLSVYDLTLVL
jgi:hypothetical protein